MPHGSSTALSGIASAEMVPPVVSPGPGRATVVRYNGQFAPLQERRDAEAFHQDMFAR